MLSLCLEFFNLTFAGKVTNKLSPLISLKLAERSETKSAKRSFASNIKIIFFDTKNRLALLASLRSAILSENEATNLLVTLPATRGPRGLT